MITSMTGFASSEYVDGDIRINCKIKTINHRFLDVTIKSHELPSDVDIYIREALSKKIKRGSVDVRFKISQPQKTSYKFNKDSLQNLLDLVASNKNLNSQVLTFADIKDVPGIINAIHKSSINKKILKDIFKKTLADLILNKKEEGVKIQKVFLNKINKINKNNSSISLGAKTSINKRNTKFRKKIKDYITDIDKERLEQEVSLLLLKHDVAEEQERISFHLSSLEKELKGKLSKGKKIDFILQELFRETSTLSVKLDDPANKSKALDMKLLVEEMREQAQNAE
ncbi:DUF1732 domain-containing protein [Gammaproteobacteria bacterium]|nr:DUF1732 domain-containing protein [Gammaproteobacteria bacterium]